MFKKYQPKNAQNPAFTNCLRDDDGKPLMVFRGQHGQTDRLQTRSTSLTFCGSADTANLYAEQPNNRREVAQAPHLIPAFLEIQNPVFVERDSPFVEMGQIQETLGRFAAEYFAFKHEQHIVCTQYWQDCLYGEFANIRDMLKREPALLETLYMNAYPLLDDPEFVDMARSLGFDGAIHVGNGASFGDLEYRIFDASQAISAITAERLSVEVV